MWPSFDGVRGLAFGLSFDEHTRASKTKEILVPFDEISGVRGCRFRPILGLLTDRAEIKTAYS